jgi:UDP-2,3-diacylglucosamine pyrophosphatase LpxH
MLVALSDLHFRDSSSGPNLPASTCFEFFRSVRERAAAVHAEQVVFLLAGDIFEFLRTELWFESDARPYDDYRLTPGATLTLRRIMDGIEEANRESLELFRSVASGDFGFPCPARFEYIPGNHDRFVHLSTELAGRAGGWLGEKGPFPQRIVHPEYGLFARHGHEYDRLNCEYNFHRIRDGFERCDDLYRLSCLGDWVAIDVGTRIPYEYRRQFPEDVELYRALRDIEDVRPIRSAFEWLRHRCDDRRWQRLKDVMRDVLESALRMEIVPEWIRTHGGGNLLPVLFRHLARSVRHLPDAVMAWLLKSLWSVDEDRVPHAELLLDRDFDASGMKTLVHGHYHDSGVEFLDARRAVVCTGGWRARHTRSRSGPAYYPGNRLGYAVFDRGDEPEFQVFERFSSRRREEALAVP